MRIEEEICRLNNDYLIYKKDENKKLFNQNLQKIYNWLDLKLTIENEKACSILCFFIREADIEVVKYLLKDDRFDPSFDESMPLLQAALSNNINILQLLLNDPRCGSSDRGNNIINEKLNFDCFNYIINHKTFNSKVYNSIAICGMSARKDEDSYLILKKMIELNLYIENQFFGILDAAIQDNSTKNALFLFKHMPKNIKYSHSDNRLIITSYKYKNYAIISQLLTKEEVVEELEKNNYEMLQKIKLKTSLDNF